MGQLLESSQKGRLNDHITLNRTRRPPINFSPQHTKQSRQESLVVRHTLRHTAITHLVQAEVDLPTVKRISGHKNLSMVERYSHQNGAHIEAAMDKLASRYRKAG
jgi:site-specific recombinase XerD